MKKAIIILLLLAVLIAAGIFGYSHWYNSTHVFVEETVYEKELTYLDLRGTGTSIAHYEELRQQMPDCEIRYDLPFQGGFLPDDTEEITITSLTAEEVELLDYLPGLKKVNAQGCRDYEQIQALQQRRPECTVLYTVTILEEEYPQDTRELFFGETVPQMQDLIQALTWLPEMETIHFDQPQMPAEELVTLRETYPQITVTWEKDAFGTTYASDVTEIDLSNMYFNSLDEVAQAMSYFPDLEKVIMCYCGTDEKNLYDDETMAAFREEMRPNFKVVWGMKIYGLEIRTDDTYFMPSKYHISVSNYQVKRLRYCEDMLCVDLGHMTIQDISFVEGMPHLKYFIVMDAPLMYIDSISTCKELIYLEFFRTWINDFTPLLGCTALEDVNVCRTNGDPMTFKDMPWLKNLWIDAHDVNASERAELEAALPDTFIKYCDGEMTANGWRNLQNYYDMRDLLEMPYNRW